MFTEAVARIITSVLPNKNWYRAAFLFTKYYAKVSKAPLGSWVRDRYPNSFRMNHAMKLEALLGALNAEATPSFPIPVRAIGKGLQDFNKSWPNGLLICAMHTPLIFVGLRHFVDSNLAIGGIIARYPPQNGYFTVAGMSVHIPAILVDRNVLLKAKGILRQGGVVLSAVDNLVDGQFSPNQFKLAAKLNAELMLILIELDPTGTINMVLLEAPEFASTEDPLAHRIASLNKQALHIMAEWP